jgi:prepilin-type N-terminal cleavage/methylation domain-containing protein
MTLRCAENRKASRGFTIIEVIISVALILSAAVIAIPFMSGTLSRNELDVAVQRAHDFLTEARSSAFSGYGDGKFGVHFETGAVEYFIGDSYSAGAPDNVTYSLPGFVEITNISISDSGNEIIFSSVSGAPNQAGSVTFTDSTGETGTIVVNVYGTISSQ